ncbi:MAG: FKBP-type peptidyl-prolyl cis-trans isomerase [Arenicellales bacterium]
MWTRILLVCVATLGVSTSVLAQELSTQKEKFSYTIGYQMGKSLMRNDLELDQDVVINAIRDALSGKDPKLSQGEMSSAIAAQRVLLQKKFDDLAAANLARSKAYLEKNKQRPGVKVTDSGLQYEVLTEGTGARPKPSDTVVVNYKGSLIDGTVFDSTYERKTPATMPLEGVIKGWKEGLQLMKEGAKYKFYIPPDLAYGKKGAGERIGPNEALIFEVELLHVK